MQGKANTKSIYNILVAEEFAIGKLERRGQPYVAQRTILRAVSLASLPLWHLRQNQLQTFLDAFGLVQTHLDTFWQFWKVLDTCRHFPGLEEKFHGLKDAAPYCVLHLHIICLLL